MKLLKIKKAKHSKLLAIDKEKRYIVEMTEEEYLNQDKTYIYETFTIPNLEKLIVKLGNDIPLNGEERDMLKNILSEQKTERPLDEKLAFKTVSKFIKKYYPFRYGKNWDKRHGKIDFILGGYALEEWINYFADTKVDIETFKKEMEK